MDDPPSLIHQELPSAAKLVSSISEIEQIDKLCEEDRLSEIVHVADEVSYPRLVLYLKGLATVATGPEERSDILRVCFEVCKKFKNWSEALRIALKLVDESLVRDCFHSCEDRLMQKQMAFIVHRQRFNYDFDGDEELQYLASGQILSSHYLQLAKELEVLDVKTPEDVYKSYLNSESRLAGAAIDSAKQNLAATFVNAFVNCGYKTDGLMLSDATTWINKNKDHGMMSATASLGALLLWDVDEGLSVIDKFQYSGTNYVKAGALMGFGLVASGVTHDADASWALLKESLESSLSSEEEKLAAVVGIGFAYAGTCRDDLLESMVPLILDCDLSTEISAMAAVSLGLVFVTSCNDTVSQAILQTLIERSCLGQTQKSSLYETFAPMFGLALGLVFLTRQEMVETVVSAVDAIEHPLKDYVKNTVTSLAFAASGDVLRIQELLQVCATHPAEEEEDEKKEKKPENSWQFLHQQAALLGIPLIALGDNIGTSMTLRSLEHVLQYGNIHCRRAVASALGLHSVSNPTVTVIELLSKLSHDVDQDTAMNAILSMGLVGAGTNNARIANLLRQLANYYYRDANHLFMVRIAQGLLYMGKGLITISPLHSDQQLVSPVALGALLVLSHSSLQLKSTVLAKSQYLLFHVIPAAFPRMVVTLDEDLVPINVPVRVGKAVDITGQAGKPKSITGFQTFTTPVILPHGERVELATDKYLAKSSVMDTFVILSENPDYQEEES